MQGEDYGLSTADILSLSDKDLNQLVGLRKYAPYREDGFKKRAKRDAQHKLGNLKRGQLVRSRAYFAKGSHVAIINAPG